MDMNSTFKLKPTDLFICCISKEIARKKKDEQYRLGNKSFR